MNTRKLFIVFILIISLMLFQVLIAGAQDQPRIWLDPDTIQAAAGDEFTVTIRLEGAQQAYGGSFKLSYDPLGLEVVAVENKIITPGDFFAGMPNFTLKNTAEDGVIEYALTLTQPAEPIDGGGILGTILFRALSDGVVNLTPVEASLVTPQFATVDGRRVAQSISQVTASFEGSTVTVGVGASSPSVASASLSNPQQSATASVSAPVQQPVTTTAAPAARNDTVLLIVVGVFFTAGLAMLTFSVGLYARMRLRFSFISDNHLE